MWRILIRAVLSSKLDDERSDDEEEEKVEKKKTPQLRSPYQTRVPNGVSSRAGRTVTVVENDGD